MNNRIRYVQNKLEQKQAALITGEPNRFYYTGFDTSDGYVLISKDSACFWTDSRYIEKAREVVKHCEVREFFGDLSEINEVILQKQIQELFVETGVVSMMDRKRLQKAFSVSVSEEEFLDQLIGEQRSIKSPDEISAIRAAQEMTDDTFRYILPRITTERTEKEIMLDMEFYMRGLGSEGVSFDFIVVSGKNSSLPHGVPTDKKIEHGDFVTMDFGAVVKGYHSDMTRTVAVGKISEEQKKVYETVLKAQKAALNAIRPGVSCMEIDKIARTQISDAGYGKYFGHGLGHGVGIEIHEKPNFNTRCQTVTKQGMILTVEPGIYLDGRFGVRIEDMVCITENGFENLTKSPKELLVL